jgi:hypothetical protein
MDAQGLLDVIEKRSQLDDAEDTEPGIWCVRFYFLKSVFLNDKKCIVQLLLMV